MADVVIGVDSGVTESLFWGTKGGGGADLRLGCQEDDIAMISVDNYAPPHSYATGFVGNINNCVNA